MSQKQIDRGNKATLRCKRSQSGAAILAILAMILVVFTASLLSGLSLNKQQIQKGRHDAMVMAMAKEALLGYALRQSPPGQLPCPDVDGDGNADASGGSCDQQRGYLPYKTLHIKETRDASNALLWYAPEINYTESSSVLNSSTSSSMRLNTNDVIAAVILAPGPELSNQSRTNDNVNNYLEEENADANTTSYIENKSATNNDNILPIYISAYWSTIEQHVLSLAGLALEEYRDTTSCNQYPFAAGSSSPYDSVSNAESGVLPSGASIASGGASACPSSLNLPAWFSTHWAGQIYYAFCESSGSDCLNLSGDVSQSANLIVFAPGSALAGQTRPSASLSDYFEEDNADADLDFAYRKLRNHDDAFNDTVYIFAP